MPFFNQPFSTIYLENEARAHPKAEQLLTRFPKATVIPIESYKEVLNRNHQNFAFQKQSPQLILAKRQDEFLYPGSSVAPDFGEKNFFYNTLALNCLYNCEYCYLQGMFQSAHLVAFVNNEDFIECTRKSVLELGTLYLCLSYDTDLLALDGILGYCQPWLELARELDGLTLELRTKSVNIKPLLSIAPHPRAILAWTLSPEYQAKHFEQGAPGTKARIKAMKQVASHGWPVRICLDPILPFGNWKEDYQQLFDHLVRDIEERSISQISIGTYRIGKTHFKRLKKVQPYSRLVHEPYEERDGVHCYSEAKEEEVLSVIEEQALQYFPAKKICLHRSQIPKLIEDLLQG